MKSSEKNIRKNAKRKISSIDGMMGKYKIDKKESVSRLSPNFKESLKSPVPFKVGNLLNRTKTVKKGPSIEVNDIDLGKNSTSLYA